MKLVCTALNQSPFVPAEAGTQGRELGQRTGSPLPRGRTEEATNSAHLALILKQQRRLNEPACQRRSKGEARLLAILLNTRGAQASEPVLVDRVLPREEFFDRERVTRTGFL